MKYLQILWLAILLAPGSLFAWRPVAEERVVFFGDSITASGQYTVYLEAYLRTRFPDTKWAFINSGKSSETLSGLSEQDHPGKRRNAMDRFVNDVALYSPTLVISCFGINDGIYHPYSDQRFGAFTNGVGKLIERVLSETKATLVLCTPPTYDPIEFIENDDKRPEETYGYKQPYSGYDDVMARYAGWVRTVSDPGIVIADVHRRMRHHLDQRRKQNPNFRLQGDGIHPNETGHLLMALAIIDALQLQGPANVLNINSGTNKVLVKLPLPVDSRWDRQSLFFENFHDNYNRTTIKSDNPNNRQFIISVNGSALTNVIGSQLAKGINIPPPADWPPALKASKLPPAIANLRKTGFTHFRARAHEIPENVEKLEHAVVELSKPEQLTIVITPHQP